jgi:hypothetical protein
VLGVRCSKQWRRRKNLKGMRKVVRRRVREERRNAGNVASLHCTPICLITVLSVQWFAAKSGKSVVPDDLREIRASIQLRKKNKSAESTAPRSLRFT